MGHYEKELEEDAFWDKEGKRIKRTCFLCGADGAVYNFRYKHYECKHLVCQRDKLR